MPTKIAIFTNRVQQINQVLSERLGTTNAQSLAETLVRGTEGGLEFGDFENWLENRFQPQLVWLDANDYTRAITRALPQALGFAAADFGSTRQRDLGQLWTDTARGFLGEIAFQKFLQERFQTTIEPDISMDKTRDEYIATDIKSVADAQTGLMRQPKINVSIKTGKFNARWMDEYSAKKTETISAFVFVRVGTVREHFIAFLKAISFLGTKLFPAAEKLGELTPQSRDQLWNAIPEFEQVPAYISGYLLRSNLNLPIHHLNAKLTGIKNKRVVIMQGVGNFSLEVLRADSRIQALDPTARLPLVIDGIGSEVDQSSHFYANTGVLEFGLANWQTFVESL